jgi:prolyl oligopeptidase PreP (S9A serine peptidase family)
MGVHTYACRARYPRVVREWKRGTPLDSANAVKVFEGEAADVAVSGYMVELLFFGVVCI